MDMNQHQHHAANESHMDNSQHHGDMTSSSMMMHGDEMMPMGNLQRKFWVSVILTLPLLLMTPMMGMTLPFQLIFPGSTWVAAVLGTVIYLYGGSPFYNGARGELHAKRPAMMTLITLGITVAYGYSLYGVIHNTWWTDAPAVTNFFWEMATLIDIMLLGHWLEMKALMQAGSATSALAQLLPDQAHVITDQGVEDRPIASLKVGDRLQVKAGEKIAADGQVKKGHSTVDESLVTGEATAITKQIDDQVIGGSLNGSGTLEVEVTKVGADSFLHHVMNMVEQAQSNQSAVETLADRVAGYLFYAAVAISVIAFSVWLQLDSLTLALSTMVAVLIIACPHALGLAVPLVTSRSAALAAQKGVLIRQANALEQAHTLRFLLLDKTGTLTEGRFKLQTVKSYNPKMSEADILTTAASLEQDSSHPLALGLLQAAQERQLTLQPVEASQTKAGYGQFGQLSGVEYGVVSVKYLLDHHLDYDEADFNHWAQQGLSVSYVLKDHQVLGLIAEGDALKPGAKQLIKAVKRQHIVPVMLTGDNEQAAQTVAKQLGITEVKAQLLPQDKEKLVQAYRQRGTVMFVGDGVNDAPSLAQADIGMAIGSGTDVALEAADVILVSSQPQNILDFLNLARATHQKMVQNLWWGAGYNILALPLAAGILMPLGFRLDPMVGAVIMSLSTIIVAVNAISLKIPASAT